MSKDHYIIDGIKYIKESLHHHEKVNLKKTTVVNFILDMSGSMTNVWDATIDGFNEYVQGLKNDGSDYRISLTIFDTVVENPYTNVPIEKVKELTRKVYHPRGATALYDAVCSTVNKVHESANSNEKHLVVIMTDGEENSSREYSSKDMKALKEKLTAEGNWTFVFLGANQDAWATAQNWGYDQMNVASYNSTTLGSRAAFSNMSASTINFARSADTNTQAFMSQDQIDKIKMSK